MARKGNNPSGSDGGEKDTGTRRRYQSPQTPPQAPGSRQRSREHGSQGMEYDEDDTQSAQRPGQAQEREEQWDGEAGESADGATRFGSQGQGDGGSYMQRGADFDLQRASRDELNAIARELDIEDFESMNREELVTEIRERS